MVQDPAPSATHDVPSPEPPPVLRRVLQRVVQRHHPVDRRVQSSEPDGTVTQGLLVVEHPRLLLLERHAVFLEPADQPPVPPFLPQVPQPVTPVQPECDEVHLLVVDGQAPGVRRTSGAPVPNPTAGQPVQHQIPGTVEDKVSKFDEVDPVLPSSSSQSESPLNLDVRLWTRGTRPEEIFPAMSLTYPDVPLPVRGEGPCPGPWYRSEDLQQVNGKVVRVFQSEARDL